MTAADGATTQDSPPTGRIAAFLQTHGKTREDWLRVARAVKDSSATQTEVLEWKQRAANEGLVQADSDAVERVILSYAVGESRPQVGSLRVHPAVKSLINKEFELYEKPPGPKPTLVAGADPFVSACKIATLRRFPAGPMDWVISGLPLSWFRAMPRSDIARVAWFTWTKFGGRGPAFYIHIASPPRNRSLVIETEVRRAYYRMARSLELQPEMKGILCAAWFLDLQAVEHSPHLAALNEPFRSWGGSILTNVGPATPESGFLKYNPERRKAYEEGKLKYMLTLGMWPRSAAISWARQHPELD